MKKSELRFKCVIQSLEIESSLKQILGVNNEKPNGNCFARYQDGYLETVASVKTFCAWPEPIMSYEDALKLIESIEPEAPKFDIKPFDRILARGANGSEWLARLYESKGICSFMETGGCFCNQLIKYDGNEHLHRTVNPAAGWWECENGKPVWKTK